jgi:hypothetical protein
MKCKNAKTLGKPCANGLSMAIVCSKGLGNCIRACSVRCKGFEQDIEFSRRIQGRTEQGYRNGRVSTATVTSTGVASVNNSNAVSHGSCCGQSKLPENQQKPQ